MSAQVNGETGRAMLASTQIAHLPLLNSASGASTRRMPSQ